MAHLGRGTDGCLAFGLVEWELKVATKLELWWGSLEDDTSIPMLLRYNFGAMCHLRAEMCRWRIVVKR